MTHVLGPTLHSDRLDLRPPHADDFPAFASFLETDRARFVARQGQEETEGKRWRMFAGIVGHWALHGYGLFTMVIRANGQPVGMCGPWFPIDWPERELGWSIWSADQVGQGLIQEAIPRIRAHIYGDLGWATAVSYIDPANARSIATAERLGCTLDQDAARPGPTDLVYRHPKPEVRP